MDAAVSSVKDRMAAINQTLFDIPEVNVSSDVQTTSFFVKRKYVKKNDTKVLIGFQAEAVMIIGIQDPGTLPGIMQQVMNAGGKSVVADLQILGVKVK
ncbi:hypothetical protein CYMTET_37799 [Cymbomonas tetramitiformis]|uniref:Uncharacterized protein n=1 Tax=Cymbomonas tetramitiformis TaxID=36881 RepID=A0AAE0CD58_9CHLO|nr:hypothetical protein CYMTET_37799 [Cymbomonas tetramitiformis]